MSLTVTFRAVGVFLYFENLELQGVTPDSRVKAVMDEIIRKNEDFDYKFITLGNGKEIVSEISYDYDASSDRPPNTSAPPVIGPRSLKNQFPANPALIWQYYRSVTGRVGSTGPRYNIRTLSEGQPSFAEARMNDDLVGPPDFQIESYDLIWRLVQIQISPEKLELFQAAMKSEVSRRSQM